jgi:hypothetical protein
VSVSVSQGGNKVVKLSHGFLSVEVDEVMWVVRVRVVVLSSSSELVGVGVKLGEKSQVSTVLSSVEVGLVGRPPDVVEVGSKVTSGIQLLHSKWPLRDEVVDVSVEVGVGVGMRLVSSHRPPLLEEVEDVVGEVDVVVDEVTAEGSFDV